MHNQQFDQKQLQEISNNIWNQYFKQIGQVNLVPEAKFNIIHLKQYGKSIIICHYQLVPSTMILSERWPRQKIGENDIFCFIADEQNKGIGQRDNKWISPKGNLYMTLLTLYDITEIVKLPIKVSNSLTQTISEFIDRSLIRTKWINDIFLDGRKTAGILIKNELNSLCNSNIPTAFCQIGLGINVKLSPSQDFTNLQKYCPLVDLEKLNLLLLEIITKNLFFINNFAEQKKIYEKNLLFMEDWVQIYDASLTNKFSEGLFKGLNDYGHAIIITKDGEQKVISDGRMRGKKNPVLDSLSIKIRMQELI